MDSDLVPVSAAALLPVVRADYSPVIKRYNAWAKGRPVTEETVREFFEAQAKAGFSARSIAFYKVAIKAAVMRAFPSYDTRVRASMDALFKSIKVPKADRTLQGKDVFSPAELRACIKAARPHVGLFIKLLYNTGARISEGLSIRLDHCKADRGDVLARITGKGARERTLTLDAKLFAQIRKVLPGKVYLFEHDGRPYGRRWMGEEIKRAGREAVGRHIHPHALRHSRATHLLAAGVPLDAVSRFLGHAQTSTTLSYYAHNSADPAVLKRTSL